MTSFFFIKLGNFCYSKTLHLRYYRVTASRRLDPDCGDPRKWWVIELSNDLIRYVARASIAVFAVRLKGPCGEFPAVARLHITIAGEEVGLSVELIDESVLSRILEDTGLEMINVNGKLTMEEFGLLLNNNIVGDTPQN